MKVFVLTTTACLLSCAHGVEPPANSDGLDSAARMGQEAVDAAPASADRTMRVAVDGGSTSLLPVDAKPEDAAVKPPADAPPASATLFRIRIATGKVDRRGLPAQVRAPVALPRGAALWLVPSGSAGQDNRVAAQADDVDDHLLSFVLPDSAGAGVELSFDLKVGAAPPPTVSAAAVVQEAGRLELRRAGRPALRFNTDATTPPPGAPSTTARSGYAHPLFAPSGDTLTEDYPADHPSHHGLWAAWPGVTVDGHRTDFWVLTPQTAVVRLVRTSGRAQGEVLARFAATNQHVDVTVKPEVVVLEESQRYTLWNTDAGQGRAFLLDVEASQRNLRPGPVDIKKDTFGGFALRGASAWKDAALEILTSEGKDKTSADTTGARWVVVRGQQNGRWSSVAMVGARTNPRFPEPLGVHPTLRLVCFAPHRNAPYEIPGGGTTAARYRLVVADGRIDAAEVERVFRDLDVPAVITTELPKP